MQLLDRFTFRRYSIIVADQFGYLPEGGFGYSGLGGLIPITRGGNLGLQTGLIAESVDIDEPRAEPQQCRFRQKSIRI